MKFEFSTDVELKEAIENLDVYVKGGFRFYGKVICGRREHGESNKPYIQKELLLNGYVSREGLIKFCLIVEIKTNDTISGCDQTRFFKLDTMDLKKAIEIFNKIKSIDDDFEKLQSEVE